MSKVYILWARTNYEPSTIVGIFASEISANERLEQIERQLLSRPEWPGNGTESEEDDAWERLEKWREDNPDAFCCEFSDTRQIEEFDLQGSHLPQDVEEFIAGKQTMLPGTNFGMVMCEDLRAWMADHVRVPVDVAADAQRYQWIKNNATEKLTEGSLASQFLEHKCEFVFPRLISWADFCGPITLDEAIDFEIERLNASKGE